ncbi:Uncharacterised protein [Mycobacteroides abscessus subsp. abscessus]|nr:Uncharacterised protein [Mycobacteroides abscessus subsp. abscessus]
MPSDSECASVCSSIGVHGAAKRLNAPGLEYQANTSSTDSSTITESLMPINLRSSGGWSHCSLGARPAPSTCTWIGTAISLRRAHESVHGGS